jgi:hypothetical protein
VQVEFRADGVLHQFGNRFFIGLRHGRSVWGGQGSVQRKAAEFGYCRPAKASQACDRCQWV